MANEQNLRPNTTLSKEEAEKLGRAGGIKSGEARRRKKQLKEELEIIMETLENGKTYQELISTALVKEALKGNTKAYEVIRDTMGQKPVEQIQQLEPPKIVDDI